MVPLGVEEERAGPRIRVPDAVALGRLGGLLGLGNRMRRAGGRRAELGPPEALRPVAVRGHHAANARMRARHLRPGVVGVVEARRDRVRVVAPAVERAGAAVGVDGLEERNLVDAPRLGGRWARASGEDVRARVRCLDRVVGLAEQRGVVSGIRSRLPEHGAVRLVPDLPVADAAGEVLDGLPGEEREGGAAGGGVGPVLVVGGRRTRPARRIRERREHPHSARAGGVDQRVVVRPVERCRAVPLHVRPLDVDAHPTCAHRGQLVELAVPRGRGEVLGIVERHPESAARQAHGGSRRLRRSGRLCGGGRRGLRCAVRHRRGRLRPRPRHDRSPGALGADLDPAGRSKLARAPAQGLSRRRRRRRRGSDGPDPAVARARRRSTHGERQRKRHEGRKDQSSKAPHPPSGSVKGCSAGPPRSSEWALFSGNRKAPALRCGTSSE
jgi:hypothetical protein